MDVTETYERLNDGRSVLVCSSSIVRLTALAPESTSPAPPPPGGRAHRSSARARRHAPSRVRAADDAAGVEAAVLDAHVRLEAAAEFSEDLAHACARAERFFRGLAEAVVLPAGSSSGCGRAARRRSCAARASVRAVRRGHDVASRREASRAARWSAPDGRSSYSVTFDARHEQRDERTRRSSVSTSATTRAQSASSSAMRNSTAASPASDHDAGDERRHDSDHAGEAAVGEQHLPVVAADVRHLAGAQAGREAIARVRERSGDRRGRSRREG